MNVPHLVARLRSHEDALVERKPESLSGSEIMAAVVAFANSVRPDMTGVIFFGVADDGSVMGVSNSDSLLKTLRKQLHQGCYPKIKYEAHVLEVDGKSIVAVEVPSSAERPHFAGGAYVREGSESVLASPVQYERLIASRHTVAGVLADAIGETWTVMADRKAPWKHEAESGPVVSSGE
jgi:predicted HTH transcriptional regulator